MGFVWKIILWRTILHCQVYKPYSNKAVIDHLYHYKPHKGGHGSKDWRLHRKPCHPNIHHIMPILNNGTHQCLGNLGKIQMFKIHLGNMVGEDIVKGMFLYNIQHIHSILLGTHKIKGFFLILLCLNSNNLHHPFSYKTSLDQLKYLHNQ